MYIVSLRFKNKLPHTAKRFISQHNAYQYAEDLAIDILQEHQGTAEPVKIHKVSLSGKWGRLDQGYNVVSSGDKITVVDKQYTLFGSLVEVIWTIRVIKDTTYVEPESRVSFMSVDAKTYFWEEVIYEMIKRLVEDEKESKDDNCK